MSYEYSEDNLVEQACIDVLESLGWDIKTAWKKEKFGIDGTFGRETKSEVILKKYLLPTLEELNPNLPKNAYEEAFRIIASKTANKKLIQINKEKYEILKNGVEVSFRDEKGKLQKKKLKIFNFKEVEKNNFLAVRQFEVNGDMYNRRPDIIGFVNGIPLVFFELKAHHRDLYYAYSDNLTDYKDTIPHLFYTNAFVILSNGLDKSDESGTKIGTISSPYKFFHEWKRIEEDEEGVVSLDTTIRGVCDKKRLLDMFENFILFDDSSGDIAKILAKNHQFIGVNKALENVSNMKELKGKLGVFWHTQGSGKSYSMVFLAQKIHRKLSGSYSIVVVLDRTELENQIYETFTAVGAVNSSKKIVANSRKHLRELLKEDNRYIFTLIHKFSIDKKKESEYPLLSDRKDIIVISDEAHRTQGGAYARNMRYNAIPNASYLGFTGTPIIKGEEEYTKNIFGEYVSIYDFNSAVEDGATLPLVYINKGEELKLENPEIDDVMVKILEDESLDQDQKKKLGGMFYKSYPILTSEKRLRAIAKDLVWHFNERGYQGKAMFIALDKPTAIRIYDYAMEYWPLYLQELQKRINDCNDEQESLELQRKYKRVEETEVCVIVSSEQNEISKFKDYGLDIKLHREKMVKRDLEKEFKDNENPFRLAIVCAMWITGFDVPSVSTVYLDKPIKGHTLMQTIARSNRVYDDEKENGLVVDYGNVYQNLEEAYGKYGDTKGTSSNNFPSNLSQKNKEEHAQELRDVISSMIEYLKSIGFDLNNLVKATVPLQKLTLLNEAVNVICFNDVTRAKFEVMAREVFKKFKSVYPEKEAKEVIKIFNAIDAIYNALNQKVKKADITSIIKKLQSEVDKNVDILEVKNDGVYIDLSGLDIQKVKEYYDKESSKNKLVFDLKTEVEKKLKKMLSENPLRIDFYDKYQKIIKDYNKGKNAQATKKAFVDLVEFVEELDIEEQRAIKEGLDKESLAIFDLLVKDNLNKKERDKVKEIAIEILEKLKKEKLKIDMWRESAQITAQVRIIINDDLWNLPEESYPDEEIEIKTDSVYQHIHSNYYGSGQSTYNTYVV